MREALLKKRLGILTALLLALLLSGTVLAFPGGGVPKILEAGSVDVEGETSAQIIRLKVKNVGIGEDTFMVSSIDFGGDPIYLTNSSQISLEAGEVGWMELEVSTSHFEAKGTYNASVKLQAVSTGEESETFTWSGEMTPHEEAAEEEAYADVTIQVLNPDSDSVQGATVTLPGYGSQQTSMDGTASWTNVAVGDYTVQVSHHELGRTFKTITVTRQGAFETIRYGGWSSPHKRRGERNNMLLAMGGIAIAIVVGVVLYTRKKKWFGRGRR